MTTQLWVKVRYDLEATTQTIKLKDFMAIEKDFLPLPSKFSDGFIGFYHKDALKDGTSIQLIPGEGNDVDAVIISKHDGVYGLHTITHEEVE